MKVMNSKSIQQVYILKINATEDDSTCKYLEYVFLDYSASRKRAIEIVRRKNNRINYFSLEEYQSLLIETSPDCWTSENESISIEVLKVRDFSKEKKMPSCEYNVVNILNGKGKKEKVEENDKYLNRMEIITI